jgi:hypothetical protein
MAKPSQTVYMAQHLPTGSQYIGYTTYGTKQALSGYWSAATRPAGIIQGQDSPLTRLIRKYPNLAEWKFINLYQQPYGSNSDALRVVKDAKIAEFKPILNLEAVNPRRAGGRRFVVQDAT